MFGLPLHPLVVHFPIVLAFLLPISALVAILAIRKGTTLRRTWAVPVAFAAGLALSAYVAVQTGEAQEDRVERVVSDRPMHAHEEAAERFLLLSGILVLVAGVGFARGAVGRAARLVTAAGAVALVGVGAQVGHSGGSLVYRHGAASAYVTSTAAGGEVVPVAEGRDEDGDDR
jgi:uncharacterized membrane protein